MLGPWPNRGIDHSTAACVWRESDPWLIIHMHNIYITDYNRIIPHRSGDVPHITGGITHLLSGMRPKVVSAWCPLMIDCHQSPGHMTRFIPWKPALGLGPCKQRLHRGPCWQVTSVFFGLAIYGDCQKLDCWWLKNYRTKCATREFTIMQDVKQISRGSNECWMLISG